ncbi:probable RNA-binding protein EIF1AD [Photinus pyralis]|nr:probable RNA-binding protein EIF1AD [Photinus pyralis]
MPTKFRKNIWIKRGDFVIVEPIEEGDRVKAEIVRVLTNDHIKYFKKDGVWPADFNSKCGNAEEFASETCEKDDGSSSDSEGTSNTSESEDSK